MQCSLLQLLAAALGTYDDHRRRASHYSIGGGIKVLLQWAAGRGDWPVMLKGAYQDCIVSEEPLLGPGQHVQHPLADQARVKDLRQRTSLSAAVYDCVNIYSLPNPWGN